MFRSQNPCGPSSNAPNPFPRVTASNSACIEVGVIWWLLVSIGIALLASVLFRIHQLEAQALQNTRMRTLLHDLHQRAEADLAIGFDLSQSTSIQSSMDDVLEHDKSLVAVEILGPQGICIASTDQGAIGEHSPPEWLAAMASKAAKKDLGWTAAAGGNITLGMPLKGPFDEMTGHLTATSERLLPPHPTKLMIATFAVWLAFSAAAWYVVQRTLVEVEGLRLSQSISKAAAHLVDARGRQHCALGLLTESERTET